MRSRAPQCIGLAVLASGGTALLLGASSSPAPTVKESASIVVQRIGVAESMRSLRVVLAVQPAQRGAAITWEPLAAAVDDTGRSLLAGASADPAPVPPGVHLTTFGLDRHQREFSLSLPSPRARRIARLAGAIRVTRPGAGMVLRFNHPLRASPVSRKRGGHRVVVRQARRVSAGYEVRIGISPAVGLRPGHEMSMTWQGCPPPTALLDLQSPRFCLVLGDGTRLLPGQIEGWAAGSSEYELTWAGIRPGATIRALECELHAKAQETRVPFVLADVPLPGKRGGSS